MSNLFKKAAATPVKPAAKAKGKEDIRVAVSGFEAFAAVDAVSKSIDAVKKSLEQNVKQQGVVDFITRGMAARKRPDNFKAFEGAAEGSVQIKAKASNIHIPQEDQDRLTAAGVPLKTTDTIVSTFIINPAYASNEALLELVSQALANVPGLPEDFIQHQQEQKVICDGDTTLDALFRVPDANLIETLLPAVASIAVRPSYKGSMNEAFNLVGDMLAPEEGE